MYHQQWLINKHNEAISRQEEYLRRSEALKAIEQRRKGNPNLPEPDETRLQQIRKEYKRKYGYDLPWEEAYEKLIAQEAISGNPTQHSRGY